MRDWHQAWLKPVSPRSCRTQTHPFTSCRSSKIPDFPGTQKPAPAALRKSEARKEKAFASRRSSLRAAQAHPADLLAGGGTLSGTARPSANASLALCQAPALPRRGRISRCIRGGTRGTIGVIRRARKKRGNYFEKMGFIVLRYLAPANLPLRNYCKILWI